MITAQQAAALAGTEVRMATLMEMRFASRTERLWNGVGTITVAGVEWRGLGRFGAIDGLPQTRSITADKVTFTLSGVSEDIQAIAANARADVKDRMVLVWFQLFGEDWQPVGPRIPAWWGLMQRVRMLREKGSDEHAGERAVAVEAENPYAGRARPASGRFTDRDQQARFPGDKFCRFVARQARKRTTWPDY